MICVRLVFEYPEKWRFKVKMAFSKMMKITARLLIYYTAGA